MHDEQGATADGYTPTALSKERTRAARSYRLPTATARPRTGACRARRAAPDRRRTGFPRCLTHAARIPGGYAATHRPLDRSSTLPCRRLSVRRVTVRRIVAANCQGDVDVTSIETGPSWVGAAQPAQLDAGVEAGGRRARARAARVWRSACCASPTRRARPPISAAAVGCSRSRNESSPPPRALRVERDQATLFAASNGNGDRGRADSSRQRADEALEHDAQRARRRQRRPRARHRGRAAAQPRTFARAVACCAQTVTGTPSAPYDQVVNRYTDVIGPIDVLDRAMLRQQRTPATAGLADASTAVTSALGAALAPARRPRGRHPRGQAARPATPPAVNAATASSSPTTATTRPRWPPSSSANVRHLARHLGHQPRRTSCARPSSPRRSSCGPIWPRATGTRPRPGAAERRPHAAGADQRRASRPRPPPPRSAPATSPGINSVILMLGLLLGRHDRRARGAVADPLAAGAAHARRWTSRERRLPQAVESMRSGEAPGRRASSPSRCTPATRSGRSPARSTRCTGRPSARRRPGGAAGERQQHVRQPVAAQPGASSSGSCS